MEHKKLASAVVENRWLHLPSGSPLSQLLWRSPVSIDRTSAPQKWAENALGKEIPPYRSNLDCRLSALVPIRKAVL